MSGGSHGQVRYPPYWFNANVVERRNRDALDLPGAHHSEWSRAMTAARASARLLRRRFRVYRTTCGCWDWMPADEWGRWQG